MERKVVFLPAYDSSKDGGSIGSVDIRFVLIGEKGATEFQLLSKWLLPANAKNRIERIKEKVWRGEDRLIELDINPAPLDVCCFSLTKLHDDFIFFENGVSYVFDGQPCYYDHKFEYDEAEKLYLPDSLYLKLIRDGDEIVWKYLENYYYEVFG
jgi:hypothetical protein